METAQKALAVSMTTMPNNKSRFAPVASLGHLRKLRDYDALGDYHLLLAHKVLENRDGWEDLFLLHRTINGGDNSLIIMDNSLIELGSPLPMEKVLEAAQVVGATYVVLEDHLSNMEKTIISSRQSMREFRRLTSNSSSGPNRIGTIGVVQGSTKEELLYCAEIMCDEIQVDLLSVPRVVTKTLGSRARITAEIGQTHGKPIHLMGFSDDLLDDIVTAVIVPEVTGIDSAVPIRLGLQGSAIQHVPECGPRSADYLDLRYATLPPLSIQNVVRFRNWISRQ